TRRYGYFRDLHRDVCRSETPAGMRTSADAVWRSRFSDDQGGGAGHAAPPASPLNAFKIVNTTETVGAFVQDRQNGIMGVPGRESKMIPVTVVMHSAGDTAGVHGTTTKEFHYEILNNARLSPVAMMATVFNALHGTNEYGEDITYRMNGVLSVKGYPDVTLRNMFAPQDNGQPAAAMAAATIGDRFARIY